MRDLKTLAGAYVLGALIVWASLIIASAMLLEAADFQKMWPIFLAGGVYFVILVPVVWQHQQSKQLHH